MTNNDNNTSDVFFQNLTSAVDENPAPNDAPVSGSTNAPINTFTPNNNETNNNKMKPNKKPKEKSMFLPIAAVCLILVVAVSAVTFVLLSGRDKKSSLKNQPSLFEGLFDFQSPIDEYLGTEAIQSEFMSGKAEISGEFTLTNFIDDDKYSGAGLEYAYKRNAKTKETEVDIKTAYNHANGPSAVFYMNPDNLQFKIPTKSENVFNVDFDSLIKKMKELLKEEDSYLSEQDSLLLDTYLNKDSISAYLGDLTESCGKTDSISILIYAIKETYPADYKAIIDGITSEKAEDDEYGNSGIKYTISEDSIELLVKRFLTVTLDNKELNKQYNSFYRRMIRSYSLTKKNCSEKEAEEKLRSEMNSISSTFAMFFNEDVTVTIWKNKNGLLTGLESSTDINLAGEIITLELQITSENDTNPSDNMTARLSLINEDESIDFYYDRTTELGDILLCKNEFYMLMDNQELFSLSFIESFDKTDNSYDMAVRFSYWDDYEEDDVWAEFSLGGKIEDLVKGSSYNLVLDSVRFDVDNENMLTAKGNIAVNTKNVSISAPTGTKKELTDMSEDELDNLFEDIFDY